MVRDTSLTKKEPVPTFVDSDLVGERDNKQMARNTIKENKTKCCQNSASAGSELKRRNRVLSEGEKDSFIAWPGKGGHSELILKRLCPLWKGLGEGFIVWGVE